MYIIFSFIQAIPVLVNVRVWSLVFLFMSKLLKSWTCPNVIFKGNTAHMHGYYHCSSLNIGIIWWKISLISLGKSGRFTGILK